MDRDEELAHLWTPSRLTINVILMSIVWGGVDARSPYLAGKKLVDNSPMTLVAVRSGVVRYGCWPMLKCEMISGGGTFPLN